ncbi:MAG: hypothetical protein JKY20_09280 [Alphaproteobacteria bacterium]|nr:hypothetical protein [Alphaproteobacteria bacterium]
MSKRRNRDPAFKARVTLEALKGERTVSDFPALMASTRRWFISGRRRSWGAQLTSLIGVVEGRPWNLTRRHQGPACEDWGVGCRQRFFVEKAQTVDRKVWCKLIARDHLGLSIGKKCELMSLSRSSFYYQAKGETELNFDLLRRIDKQLLETPFYGVRQMIWHLRNKGHLVNE